jgi:hypothetical protein
MNRPLFLRSVLESAVDELTVCGADVGREATVATERNSVGEELVTPIWLTHLKRQLGH